jgi:hypothetical protein
MHNRVIFGALAALFAAIVALDASTWLPAEYPLMKHLFDGEWIAARNCIFGIATTGSAVCGYLASVGANKT